MTVPTDDELVELFRILLDSEVSALEAARAVTGAGPLSDEAKAGCLRILIEKRTGMNDHTGLCRTSLTGSRARYRPPLGYRRRVV